MASTPEAYTWTQDQSRIDALVLINKKDIENKQQITLERTCLPQQKTDLKNSIWKSSPRRKKKQEISLCSKATQETNPQDRGSSRRRQGGKGRWRRGWGWERGRRLWGGRGAGEGDGDGTLWGEKKRQLQAYLIGEKSIRIIWLSGY